MKKVRYISHLSHGFTLIELLVVIIIIGLLSAIALPSFLNQSFKARGAEAKSNLSAINRAQQAYRLQMGTMASSLAELNPRVSGRFYNYTLAVSDRNNASATAILNSSVSGDLLNYSAAVTQVVASPTQNEFFGSIICETNQRNTMPGPAVAPTQEGQAGRCAANMQIVN